MRDRLTVYVISAIEEVLMSRVPIAMGALTSTKISGKLLKQAPLSAVAASTTVFSIS